MEIQGRFQAAVVGPDNRVSIRPVRVAERVDSLWVVEEGVKSGERVVAEGLQKVREGTVVSPKPFAFQPGGSAIKSKPAPEETTKPGPTGVPKKTTKG
jgi:membrane fusion protein (multidrug efflux system)